MVARLVRIEKVRGSIPLSSTQVRVGFSPLKTIFQKIKRA